MSEPTRKNWVREGRERREERERERWGNTYNEKKSQIKKHQASICPLREYEREMERVWEREREREELDWQLNNENLLCSLDRSSFIWLTVQNTPATCSQPKTRWRPPTSPSALIGKSWAQLGSVASVSTTDPQSSSLQLTSCHVREPSLSKINTNPAEF